MKEKTVYTIATAHLDTIWNWSFETTINEYIPKTLDKNFAYFKKYPEYKFNFEGSYRYELMEEYYPEKFEELKKYIEAGKWNVTGSAYENGDVNIPSPEALFRNFLYGNSYFDKKFGKRSTDVYLPDCFGFGYALPAIAEHSNIKGFTTQKLSWGSAYGTPFDIGKWYGVNGKYILASIKMHNYFYTFTRIRNFGFVQDKLKDNEKYGLDFTAIYHGVGDRGGAPLEPSVRTLHNEYIQNKDNDVKVVSAASDDIYKELHKEENAEVLANLPEWHNELVMTNHGAGCYTSRAIGKRWNAKNEELAIMTEKSAASAELLGLLPYNRALLEKAWKRVIAHQFHDDITGTALQKEYRRSWNDYVLSMNQFSDEYETASKAVISQLDTSFCKGIPVAVNNSADFAMKKVVKFPVELSSKAIAVFDDRGKEVPSQLVSSDGSKATVAFLAEVAPCGYRVYDIRESKKAFDDGNIIKASRVGLENERYLVKFNYEGDVCSIFDKKLSKELLSKPITFDLFDYNGASNYPSWELRYDEVSKLPKGHPKKVSVEGLYSGSCCGAVKIKKKYNGSTFETVVSLSRNGNTVDFDNEIDWSEHCTLLKNNFSFTASNAKARYDLGLGSIERRNNTPNLYEVPAQKWASITDVSKTFGVGIISDSKRGWDKPENDTLRLTVLHTPLKNFRPDSMQSQLDLGLNRYSFAVCSFENDDYTSLDGEARAFCCPMNVFSCDKHEGRLSTSFSLLNKNNDSVVVRAVKKAEDTDEYVVRVNEIAGKAQKNVEIEFAFPIKKIREIYASEEFIGDVPVKENKLVFDIEPFDIKSFAITFKADGKAKTAKTKPAAIEYNALVLTSNEKRYGAFVPRNDFSIPVELMPEKITSAGIEFSFEKDANKSNALVCDGQVLKIPAGAKKFVFIGASPCGNKNYDFFADNERRSLYVQDMSERVGGWDLVNLGEAAYIKRDPLALEFTHTHSPNGDNVASNIYFFRYEIPVEGVKKLALPEKSDLIMLSAVFTTDNENCKCLNELYDSVQKRIIDTEFYKGNKVRYVFRKASTKWRQYF